MDQMDTSRSRLLALVLLAPLMFAPACSGRPTHAEGDGGVSPDGLPPGESCASDEDCDGGSYCRKACGPGTVGRCVPVPEGCPTGAPCAYVCGCDGKTYCGECEAAQARVGVASEGMCCADINQAYQEALESAKACANWGSDAFPKQECPYAVKSSLSCPECVTYASTINATMQAMEKRWTYQGCPESACDCAQPTGAYCGAPADGSGDWQEPSGGRCVDIY